MTKCTEIDFEKKGEKGRKIKRDRSFENQRTAPADSIDRDWLPPSSAANTVYPDAIAPCESMAQAPNDEGTGL